MKKIISQHKLVWKEKKFYISATIGFFLLALSLVANYFANVYVAVRGGMYVPDIILDNLPVLNVDFVFIEGAIILGTIFILLLLSEPKKIPFALKFIALFIFIRSVFITLTHTIPPPDRSFIDPYETLSYITSGNDMFFSSHTGFPFMMALIFWEKYRWRLFFIFASLFFAASVLLGHLHYSIDVLAAYFITYSIFHITIRLFAKDYALLGSDQVP